MGETNNSRRYLQAIAQPHVSLVTDRVVEITPDGVVTVSSSGNNNNSSSSSSSSSSNGAQQLHELDVLV